MLLVLPLYFKRSTIEWIRSEHSSKLCIGNLFFIYGITEFVTKNGLDPCTEIVTCALHALHNTILRRCMCMKN